MNTIAAHLLTNLTWYSARTRPVSYFVLTADYFEFLKRFFHAQLDAL
jgi:hypothetical protein